MLRIDLEAAGSPYVVEGPDGPLFADFHTLRHTYLTLLGRGVELRTVQELAGHSTPTLTAMYSHRRLHDLAGAVEKLPDFLPTEHAEVASVALKATGTDPHKRHGTPHMQAHMQDNMQERGPEPDASCRLLPRSTARRWGEWQLKNPCQARG
jgi:hypothetical protein